MTGERGADRASLLRDSLLYFEHAIRPRFAFVVRARSSTRSPDAFAPLPRPSREEGSYGNTRGSYGNTRVPRRSASTRATLVTLAFTRRPATLEASDKRSGGDDVGEPGASSSRFLSASASNGNE